MNRIGSDASRSIVSPDDVAEGGGAPGPVPAPQAPKPLPSENSLTQWKASPNGFLASEQDIPSLETANFESSNPEKPTPPHGNWHLSGDTKARTNEAWDVDAKTLRDISNTQDLELKGRFPAGVSVVPVFHSPKTAHEVELTSALLGVVQAEPNSHQDRVVELRGVPHLITADVDTRGALSVKVHGPGAPRIPDASQFPTIDAAAKALAKDFSVTLSNEEPAFKLDELQKTHAALSLYSKNERKALEGIELRRVEKLPPAPDGSPCLAQFSGGPEGNPSRVVKRMTISDATFDADGTSFVGTAKLPLPQSVSVIAHEAAHAVEAHPSLLAMQRFLAAQQAGLHVLRQLAPVKDAISTRIPPTSPAGRAYQAALDAIDAKAEKTGPQDRALADQAVASALSALERAATLVPFKEDSALVRRCAQLINELASRARDVRAADAAMTASGPPDTTSRLKRFQAEVARTRQAPLTPYASRGNPGEAFAEALRLFKTDPEWMQQNAPKLSAWFAAEKHLD